MSESVGDYRDYIVHDISTRYNIYGLELTNSYACYFCLISDKFYMVSVEIIVWKNDLKEKFWMELTKKFEAL